MADAARVAHAGGRDDDIAALEGVDPLALLRRLRIIQRREFEQLPFFKHFPGFRVVILSGAALVYFRSLDTQGGIQEDRHPFKARHRFFDQSVPEGGIPWENLTIKQAADDQHEIIQAIRQKIYPASKWISTGISKGGQTTIFHRYFYPADVDISVPYVAPLNLEYVDPRLDKFLNRLGTAKSGVKAL